MEDYQILISVMSKRTAFTLIELLVVISIIALLLSILMPSLGKIKDQARSVVCRTNLRQLILAYELYITDHDSKALHSNLGRDMWFLQIAPYIGDNRYKEDPTENLEGVMQTLWCPSTKDPLDPDDVGCWGSNKNRWRYHVVQDGVFFGSEGSYGLNTWVGGMDIDTMVDVYGWISDEDRALSFRDNMPKRSDIPVIADSVWVESIPKVEDILYGTFNDSLEEGNNDYGIARFYIDRHSEAPNMAFTDGHAEKVKLEDFWRLKWNKLFSMSEEEFEIARSN